ncbi:MAG: hypothetical protein WAT70_10085 [Rhizobiaceae bacterium]
MTRRKLGNGVAGAYLAVAVFVLATFLMAPPDGLANVWIVLWTAPLSLPSFVLPWPAGIEFPCFPSMLGFHGRHVAWFIPATLAIAWALRRIVGGRG